MTQTDHPRKARKTQETFAKNDDVNEPRPNNDRQRMIAEAAYFRAQARGFSSGGEVDDWLQAEIEINRILGELAPARIGGR